MIITAKREINKQTNGWTNDEEMHETDKVENFFYIYVLKFYRL